MVQSKACARKTLFELLTFGALIDATQVYRTSDGAMEKGFSESLFITVNTEIIAVSRDLICAWRKKCLGKYLNYFLIIHTVYLAVYWIENCHWIAVLILNMIWLCSNLGQLLLTDHKSLIKTPLAVLMNKRTDLIFGDWHIGQGAK